MSEIERERVCVGDVTACLAEGGLVRDDIKPCQLIFVKGHLKHKGSAEEKDDRDKEEATSGGSDL